MYFKGEQPKVREKVENMVKDVKETIRRTHPADIIRENGQPKKKEENKKCTFGKIIFFVLILLAIILLLYLLLRKKQ